MTLSLTIESKSIFVVEEDLFIPSLINAPLKNIIANQQNINSYNLDIINNNGMCNCLFYFILLVIFYIKIPIFIEI